MLVIPMIFMLIVTLFALVFLIKANLAASNYVLVVFPALLFILALVLAYKGYGIVFGKDEGENYQNNQ